MSGYAERDIAAIRFGFGLDSRTPADLGPTALLTQLDRAKPVPEMLAGTRARNRLVEQFRITRDVREARRAGMMPDAAAFESTRRQVARLRRNYYLMDAHCRVIAAVESRAPLFERLVAFWSNHFTVSAVRANVRLCAGPFECEAIRPHVMGRFRDMLLAVYQHPAMLFYLDQVGSIGPDSPVGRRSGRGLNENLAREIMELHTLGVDGGYGQTDVTEFAKLLTGWRVRISSGEFEFRAALAEPGPKTLLGSTFGGDIPTVEDGIAALDMLARHPATARFVATKLARHFIADDPPVNAVRRIAQAFSKSGGHLPAVYRALVTAPEAWSLFGAKVKQPFDFLVSGLRLTTLGRDALMPRQRMDGLLVRNPLGAGALAEMAQPLWTAPSPKGWPDRKADWINPVGLTARLNWISRVVGHLDPQSPEALLDRALDSTASARTRNVVARATTPERGRALVLASPEFNRR